MPKNKYNVTSMNRNGETFHFVTRGRSKPFTDEEVNEFFGDVPQEDKPFKVDGELRRIFAQDLRFGLSFCSNKYGASESAILIEAKRLFPHQNLDKIVGSV